MTIYEIAKKLHCILNQTDHITSKDLAATVAIGNVSLLECDDDSKDNIYITICDTLASFFDPGLYGGSSGSFCYGEACDEAEKFLNSLRDESGELIEWYFPDPFTIFVKTVEDGYLSYDVKRIESRRENKREEYIKWRTERKEL